MAPVARDVMSSEVVTVTPETPLSEFARICTEDRISGAPVVTVDGRLVGIVSRTDLVEHLLEAGHAGRAHDDLRGLYLLGEEALETRRGMAAESEVEGLGTVDDFMQTDVLVVPPDRPLPEIARGMAENRVHRVVVVEENRVVGIITSLDLLGRFPGAEAAKRGPDASKPQARARRGRLPAGPAAPGGR
jgi:CBS domain-containing protein